MEADNAGCQGADIKMSFINLKPSVSLREKTTPSTIRKIGHLDQLGRVQVCKVWVCIIVPCCDQLLIYDVGDKKTNLS